MGEEEEEEELRVWVERKHSLRGFGSERVRSFV